jgi:hypothetical protein
MPWHVERRSVCGPGKPFAVVKDGTDSVIPGGCHETQEAADEHVKALYASVEDTKRGMRKTSPRRTAGEYTTPAVREVRMEAAGRGGGRNNPGGVNQYKTRKGTVVTSGRSKVSTGDTRAKGLAPGSTPTDVQRAGASTAAKIRVANPRSAAGQSTSVKPVTGRQRSVKEMRDVDSLPTRQEREKLFWDDHKPVLKEMQGEVGPKAGADEFWADSKHRIAYARYRKGAPLTGSEIDSVLDLKNVFRTPGINLNKEEERLALQRPKVTRKARRGDSPTLERLLKTRGALPVKAPF